MKKLLCWIIGHRYIGIRAKPGIKKDEFKKYGHCGRCNSFIPLN